MAIDLYMLEGSSPCRVVTLVAKYLGIELNKKHIDLSKNEHKTPEFLKMNPQHCLPTIDDNGFYLWESHAITAYLVNKYAPDSDLYPKDPKKRAVIDRFLYFDIGTLEKGLSDAMRAPLFAGEARNPEKEKALRDTLKFLDDTLAKSLFVAGEKLSLADFSILITFRLIKLTTKFIEFDLSEYCNIEAWEKRVRHRLPFFDEINEKGENLTMEYIEKNKK